MVLSGCLHCQGANPDNCCCYQRCCDDTYGDFSLELFHKPPLELFGITVKLKGKTAIGRFIVPSFKSLGMRNTPINQASDTDALQFRDADVLVPGENDAGLCLAGFENSSECPCFSSAELLFRRERSDNRFKSRVASQWVPERIETQIAVSNMAPWPLHYLGQPLNCAILLASPRINDREVLN